MNFTAENDSALQSPALCISKEELKKEKDERIPLNIQSEDDIKIEYSASGSNLANSFSGVLETPRHLEEGLINEAHSLFSNDVPFSSESDEHNTKGTEEKIVKETDQSCNSLSDDMVGKRRMRLSFCASNCHLKITDEDQKRIFDTFWQKKAYQSRFRFVYDLTESNLKPDCKRKSGYRRSTKFYLDTNEGRQRVCRLCFLSVLGVSVGFLNAVLDHNLRKINKPNKSNEDNLETGDLTAGYSSTDCEKSDMFVDMSEPLESLQDEVTNETNSFTYDDSFLQKIVGVNKKGKIEIQDHVLRKQKLQLGWTRFPPCRNYCYFKVTEQDQKRIFNSYWQEATADSRYKFIYDMTETLPINLFSGNLPNKRYHSIFYLNTSKGNQQVCRKCFRLAINESYKYILDVLEMKWNEIEAAAKNDKPASISLSQKNDNPNLDFKERSIQEETETWSSPLKNNLIEIDMQENSDFEGNDSDLADEENEETLRKKEEKSVNKVPLFSNDVPLSTKTISQGRKNKSMDDTELTEKKYERTSLDIQLEEEMNAEYSTQGSSIANPFVDVSKTPRDLEGEIIKETHSLFHNNDPLSSETDKCNTKDIDEKTAKDPGQSGYISSYIVGKYKIRRSSCRLNCHLKITEEDQKRIFDTYWRKGTFDSRFSFVNNMTEIVRNRTEGVRRRTRFYLDTNQGRQSICRLCFLSVLDVSPTFIDAVLDQKLREISKRNESDGENLETEDLKVDFSNIDCKKTSTLVDMSEALESSEDELTTETDSLSQKIVESNLKDNIEMQDQTRKEEKLLRGWTRLPMCRNNCYFSITEEDQRRIFISYWQDATVDTRYRFICDMTETVPVKLHSRSRKFPRLHRKRFHSSYYLNTDKGSKKVCRSCFRTAIDESFMFVHSALNRKWNKINAMGELKNEQLKKDVDPSLILKPKKTQEKGEKSSTLKRTLKESKKEESSNMPIEMCIIKEEVHLEDDSETEVEENKEAPKTTPKQIFDFKTEDVDVSETLQSPVEKLSSEAPLLLSNEDMKIECSTLNFNLNNDLDKASEIFRSPREKSMNEDRSLFSNDDPLSTETFKQERKDKSLNNEGQSCNSLKESQLGKLWNRLPPCSNECYLKVKENEQERIFNSYWGERTFESRFAFVKDMMELTPKADHGNKTGILGYLASFYLNTNGGHQKVCKSCFRLILDVSDAFIKAALDQKLRDIIEFSESDEEIPGTGDLKVECKTDKRDACQGYDALSDKKIKKGWTRLPPCKSNCHLKVTANNQKHIFDYYWQGSTFDSRQRFICDMTESMPVKVSSKKIHKFQPKRFATSYYLFTNKGAQKVCKFCFRFVLKETCLFIESTLDKKWNKIKAIDELNNEKFKSISLSEKDVDPNLVSKQEIMQEKGKKSALKRTLKEMEKQESSNVSKEICIVKEEIDLEDDDPDFVGEGDNEPSEKTPKKIYDFEAVDIKFESSTTGFNLAKDCVEVSKRLQSSKEQLIQKDKINTNGTFRDVSYRKKKIAEGWTRLSLCKSNCHLKISAEDQKRIFDTYWQEATTETRNRLMYDMVELVPLFDPLMTPGNVSRKFLANYYLNTDKGIQKVCKYCFCLVLNESNKLISRILREKWGAIEAMARLKIDSNFILNQKGETSSSPLGKLKEIDEEEKSNLPVETCIIKEEVDIKNDWEVQDEEPKKTPKRMSDFEIDDIKIEFSTTGFNLAENFVDVSETLQKSEEKSINQAPSLLSNVDPLSAKTAYQEINNFHRVRSWTRLSPCANKCHMKIKESDQERIFNSYWQGGTFDSRFGFVNDMTEMMPNEELKRKLHSNDRKIYDTTFYLNTDEGRQKVCRICFRLTLGEWDSFITAALEKKQLSIYKLEQHKERTLQTEKKVDTVIDQILGDKNSKDELNQDLFERLSFPHGDHLSSKIMEENVKGKSEMKIPFQSKIPSPPKEKFQENNLEGKIEKVKKKNHMKKNENTEGKLKKKALLPSGDTFSSKIVGKNSKVKIKGESKLTSSTNKKLQDQILQEKIEMLKNKYTKKTLIVKSELKNKDQASNFFTNKKVQKNVTEIFPSESKIPSPTEEDTKKIEEHIKKFPLCESYHYNRQSSEKYLPMGLTVKVMYDLYKNEVLNPLGIVWYHKILGQLDLKFKPSFLDKCEKCNVATLQYKLSNDPSEKSKINSLRTAHLLDSEEANNSKAQDEKTANTINSLMVCSFGFQQSLPTPFMDKPTAYYEQPLWTYNFTVQRQGNDAGKHRNFYMWHEGVGKRSANEIASCLYQYLRGLSPKIKFVIFYSTSCNGESRSKTLSMMFSHLVANHRTLLTVEHKFLISGHSQIEENLGNSLAEDVMKHYQGRIEQPKDWYDAFDKHLELTDHSDVTVMAPEMFYDFENMREDVLEKSEPFINKDVKWLRYTKEGVFYKKSWSENDRFQVLNLNGPCEFKELSKRKLRNVDNVSITKEKKKGLLNLLPLMSPKVKSFYENLPVQKDPSQKDADSNFSLNPEIKEKCKIPSTSLKRKFEEINKQENKNLSKETCIIKQEYLKNANLEVNNKEGEQPLDKTSKNTSDKINSSEFELIIVKKERIDRN